MNNKHEGNSVSNILRFTRNNRVPEQEKDYMPILRDRVIVEIQPKQYGLLTRALLWACFLSVYGFLFVSIYRGF